MRAGTSFKITSDYVGAKKAFTKDKKDILVAYVESYDDRRLWSKALKSKKLILKNIKLNFKAPSLKGDANGKSTLIQMYKDGDIELGKNLIICLDSDYDFLIAPQKNSVKYRLYKNEFVFQTYTYSAENHYYTTEGLAELCESAVCGELDVELCINSYVSYWSSVIYNVFCFSLFLKKCGDHVEYQNKSEQLRNILEFHFNGNLNISNLASIMGKFKKDVDVLNKTIENTCFDKNDYLSFVKALNEKGLHSNNTHMFFQGHDLEDLFLKPICISISKRIISGVKSQINQNNSGDTRSNLIREYSNSVGDVIMCIKNRTEFSGNEFLDRIITDFDNMCIKYH